MARKLMILIIVVLILTSQTGCVKKRYLEGMALVNSLGYDRLEEDRILGTSVFHVFSPEKKGAVRIVSGTAFTSKGVRQAVTRETEKKIVSGQLRTAIYGEKTAEGGIFSLVDTISRDGTISTLLYLVVVKGKANELLEYKYEKIANIGTYLYELIKQNIEGEKLVSSTIHEFLHDYYSEGKDPILPYVERNGEEVKISGAAVFKNDRMVGIISPKETFYVKLIRDRFKTGTYELSVSKEKLKKYLKKNKTETEKIYVTLDNISNSSEIDVKTTGRPEFMVKLGVKVRLLEISEELDLGKPEVVKGLEKCIAESFSEQSLDLLKKLQELESDPIGFGLRYKASVRDSELTIDKWKDLYKDATFEVKTTVDIVRTGVTD